jgi:ketosteroid isomerase-like protein
MTKNFKTLALLGVIAAGIGWNLYHKGHPRMSANKQTVQKYMNGFNQSDHAAILSCLTDDVVWDLPGGFHLVGKAAFDKEIENPAFVGKPSIRITRMTEENNVVIAEGTVTCLRKQGKPLNAVFADVFELKNAQITRLISYLMEVKTSADSR